jgi:hypothetical protein
MKTATKILWAALALLLAPALTAAQQTQPADADPIGALIEQQNGEEIDEETAETLGAAEAAREALSTPRAPTIGYTPSYARPSASGLDRPVMIHETGLSPDGPPDLSQQTYESRVRGSIAAAQGLQGPLDGAWSLTDAAGTKLYAFQMVDPGGGYGLEGAWRDVRRGGIGDVGVIDSVQRSGDALTVRFVPREGAAPVTAQLNQTSPGRWSGALTEGSGSADVTLVRDGPQAASYAAGSGVGYAPRPYDSTVRAAPRPTAKAKATASKKKKATVKKKAPAKKKKKA